MEPFEQKVDIEVNDIQKAIKKNISRPSKPVKFTWEGLRNFGLLFETNPFNSNDTEGAYRATSAIPKVSEIGRTHCNFDSLKNPFVICTSRWGNGANDYEQTYIADPFQ